MHEQICQITQDIWSTFLGLKVGTLGRGRASPPGGRSLTACVQISGTWVGAVSIECPSELAIQVAATMLGMGLSEVSLADTQDALGELANMTAGNVKTLLPETCRLSLPAVAEGQDYSLRIPGLSTESESPFECLGHPFVVRLLRRLE